MRIVLASKSGVRKEILEKNKIDCDVEPSNVDEDKQSYLNFQIKTKDLLSLGTLKHKTLKFQQEMLPLMAKLRDQTIIQIVVL